MSEPRFVWDAATRAVRNDYVQGVAARWYNAGAEDMRRFESIFDAWLEDLIAKNRAEQAEDDARIAERLELDANWSDERRRRARTVGVLIATTIRESGATLTSQASAKPGSNNGQATGMESR